jgi:hypothetical protein
LAYGIGGFKILSKSPIKLLTRHRVSSEGSTGEGSASEIIQLLVAFSPCRNIPGRNEVLELC